MFDYVKFAEIQANLDLNIGILCFMAGKLPSEIFDEENESWLSDLSYNLKIAKVFWNNFIEAVSHRH